eukprot:TRINITY_DN2407_c0_g2_i1.p1 TRINITY_DN2407_c0_g2~~TRINITY_DN2407_c0_g2_i1.p1  ORF type:complete len:302 (+),score=90.52 TRINITY_DN2407_c0_g2_i1:65-970(+)
MKAFLACIVAPLMVTAQVNVNFAACSGGTTDGCNVKKVVRYVESDFPPWDDLDANNNLAGFNVKLFDAICKSQAFAGVDCYEVRDRWSNVWHGDEYPGEGMLGGWYDFAFAFVNTVRSHSFDYGYILAKRDPNVFVANMSRAVDTVHASGEGETIAVVCGWGDTAMVIAEFPQATVLSDPVNCAVSIEAAVEKVRSGAATLAWVTLQEWNSMVATGKDTGVKRLPADQEFALVDLDLHKKEHQNGLAFMFPRQNTCVKDLVNKALAEIWDTEFKAICNADPIIAPLCKQTLMTREDLLAQP